MASLTLLDPGRQICPYPTQMRMPVKKLETTFHGQKAFRLVKGSLSWSNFHKGGQMYFFSFQTASSQEPSDRDT